MHRTLRNFVALSLTTALSGSASAAVEVNSCGQVLSGDGFLSANLDCSGFLGTSVEIQGSGKLDLRGFTLTSDHPSEPGILCDHRCLIYSSVGGGSVVGGHPAIRGVSGSLVFPTGKLTIRDIVIAGSTDSVGVQQGTLKLEGVTIQGAPGVRGGRKLIAKDSVISDSGGLRSGLNGFVKTGFVKIRNCSITGSTTSDGFAVFGSRKVVLRDSAVTGSAGDGMGSGGGAVVRDSVVSNNAGDGINATTLRISDTTVEGNGLRGVHSFALTNGRRVTIRSNGHSGIEASTLRLRRSEVTSNSNDAACGITEACADLVSPDLPKIDSQVTCETSLVEGSGIPGTSWGICSLD